MATRGCTSRAASSEPHVFRVPCTVILGTWAFTMHRSKLRLKFPGSTAVPCRVVSTGRCISMPGCPTPVGLLLGLAEPERSDAPFGQRQRGLRGLGLDLAAEELVADSLDLLTDVEFSGVGVDQLQVRPRTSPLRRPRTRISTKAAYSVSWLSRVDSRNWRELPRRRGGGQSRCRGCSAPQRGHPALSSGSQGPGADRRAQASRSRARQGPQAPGSHAVPR